MILFYVANALFAGCWLAGVTTSYGQEKIKETRKTHDDIKLQSDKEEIRFKPSTPSQSSNAIETLQWAVYLETEHVKDSEALTSVLLALGRVADLRYEGTVGKLKNWHLFSHKLHPQTRASLSRVHDNVVYKLLNSSYRSSAIDDHSASSALPDSLKGTANKNVSLRLASQLQHQNNRIFVNKNSTDNNHNKQSLHEAILPLYKDELSEKHKLSESDWRTLVDIVHGHLQEHPDVSHVIHQKAKFREKRAIDFRDPAFPEQWHLVNREEWQMDINVSLVWEAGYTGKGVTVCVVDDGIEWNNPDLYANYNKKGSWDLQKNDGDPMPDVGKAANHHGTRCAGEVAAAANSVCGVGVAFEAWISGIRIIDGPMTDAMEATAFTKNMDVNDVYSCSWGPEDDGKIVDGPDFLAEEGLRHGVDFGRHGYGSLFVVASGNGGLNDDNCNFDGYANSIYTLTIGAVDEAGMMPYYAEQCASMLAVTFSSGGGLQRQIVTTDWRARGSTGCTSSHTGTSAAAPLAAGMLALAIQANPCLTWRDFKYLIILTAVKVDEQLAHYTRNAAGLFHSHQHGFGLMDAWRLVNAARVWTQVPWMTTFSTNEMKAHKVIPGGKKRLKVSYEVTSSELDGYSLDLLEEVQVSVTLTHVVRGDLDIRLVCPSGTESVVGAPRSNDNSNEGFTDWTFTTVRCWGEEPLGTFRLVILDTGKYSYSRGRLIKWRLKLHGVPMSRSEFQQRQRKVRKSYSGEYLSKLHEPKCQEAPEQLAFTAPISQRLLKVICMSAGFCFLMAVYETLEYMFCYDEEKEEEAKTRLAARASAQPAPGAQQPGYAALQQNEPLESRREWMEMDDIQGLSRYHDMDGSGVYQGLEGDCGYPVRDGYRGSDLSAGYHTLNPDVGYQDFEINTDDMTSQVGIADHDSNK